MTKLKDILDENVLAEHLKNKIINVQHHPTLPLRIFNYSHLAQRSADWDDTMRTCRGLITDDKGEIIGRSFRKFFNLNTPSVPETLMAHLPNVKPSVTEKVDGSLGLLWRYDNCWGIATRGSFNSDQAIWATNWYAKGIQEGRLSLFQTYEFTPVFEIIYPANRIVLDYGDFEGLVLLAMVNNHTGQEHRQDIVEEIGGRRGFTGKYVVKSHGMRELSQVDTEGEAGREGLVLTFNQYDGTPPLKVKVKFDEYVRLHKIVTGMSPRAIWEQLVQGTGTGFIDGTPEHFQKWATSWVDKLFEDFNLIYHTAGDIVHHNPALFTNEACKDPKAHRKMCAEYFKQEVDKTDHPEILGICFAIFGGKGGQELDTMIWKLVKPRGDDQSFRAEGE